MFNKPDSRPDFNSLELAILEWWKQNNILDKSIDQRDRQNSRTFYDGPITANGEPHYGHLLTFAMKDIIPRFWTMQGYHVDRSLGWDCQGIPVEYEVEKQLGFKEKKDIEAYGIAKFNDLCRTSVLKFRGQIIDLEERVGRLTNDREEYYTMDADYIESIWWSLAELYQNGLLYEGFKVVPYSTRAGTSLSNAEVAMGGYKPITDPAITVEFPLESDPQTVILAWTTTPWTMPGNLGLAVNPKLNYVKVKLPDTDKTYIVARDLIPTIFGDRPAEVVAEIVASDLVGQRYSPPFDYYLGRANAHQIYAADYVTADSGTGIVHLAPYGAEDNDVFHQVGIESFDYLDEQGDFTSVIPEYAGQNYKLANQNIISDLEKKGKLFKHEQYTHDMPMCWRTDTPLIYKPITSWYIAMSTLRDKLVANNDQITWVPEHIKQGRFGNWLAEIKDWGISRLRYWGTPLPVWKSNSGKIKVIGSFAELEKLSGVKLTDPHRPFVDDVKFEFEGETYTRIPDVIDVWYDSGAMPFARLHYPFENKELFTHKFPAQYIAESIDQTRGWFYSLMALSTSLFDKPAFENVIVSGFTLDDHGVKLSKSKKNYEPPQTLLSKYGADAIRINFFTSPISAGEDATVSDTTVKAQIQDFLLPLWNCYSYLTTYANMHEWEPELKLAYNHRDMWQKLSKEENFDHPWEHIPFANVSNELDAWILATLQNTIGEVTQSLNNFEIPKATRSLKSFVDHLSKWYIRRSRDRFADGEISALETLYYVLVEFVKLSAPFVPFVSEHIYRELVASQFSDIPESIHLCDYPVVDVAYMEQYGKLLEEMSQVRTIADLGQSLRTIHGLKVRQPLSELNVQFSLEQDAAGAYLTDWMKAIIAAELNVEAVTEVPQITESENILVTRDSSNTITVGLNKLITPELAEKGLVRELTRAIQSLRKTQGFQQGEAVIVTYQTEAPQINDIMTKYGDQITQAITAQDLVAGVADTAHELNGMTIMLKLSKAE